MRRFRGVARGVAACAGAFNRLQRFLSFFIGQCTHLSTDLIGYFALTTTSAPQLLQGTIFTSSFGNSITIYLLRLHCLQLCHL